MNEGFRGASKGLRRALSGTAVASADDDEEDPVRVPDKIEPCEEGRRANGDHGDIFFPLF